MKVYLINLDKNKTRLAHMKAQLMNSGIEFERIPAVYGKSLSVDEMHRGVASFRALCAMGRSMTRGEIGCARSHLSIYKMIDEPVWVFAGGIDVSVNLKAALNECFAFLDVEKPRVVILSGHCFSTTSQARFVPVSAALCTDAYCINKAAALIIAKANYPIVSVADSWGRWSRRYGIQIYRFNPPIVRQNNARFGTDISASIRSWHGLYWVGYKVGRVFTKLIDSLHFCLFGN